jgi:spore cortex formation protein SpoVR/YcgB (stage V sporulation)
MMIDIKRICQHPTEEDRQWFPEIANSAWQETLQYAMRNFKDESFIQQYLSPHLIRQLKLFSILDKSTAPCLKVAAIHDEDGYRQVRQDLANQYDLGYLEPNIQIYNVAVKGDRSLTLRHFIHQERPLADSVNAVLRHVHKLWGFNVNLESVTSRDEIVEKYQYPLKNNDGS